MEPITENQAKVWTRERARLREDGLLHGEERRHIAAGGIDGAGEGDEHKDGHGLGDAYASP
jgi:hypothetical protein